MAPGNHVLDGAPHCPWEEAILRGEGAAHCKVYGHTAVICAKMAEPIEMSFGVWTGVGSRKLALGGSAHLAQLSEYH